ncbi:MAG TPA: hypothetical protein VHZ24_06555 [Pirellulales bacterium]|jgi:hypothetical protein|nr:hypothetical protein [Pirellulales bacterium]
MERYRIHAEAAVYFVTYSIVEWLPVFIAEASCKIVTDSLAFCHREKHLRINAYVVMPDTSALDRLRCRLGFGTLGANVG